MMSAVVRSRGAILASVWLTACAGGQDASRLNHEQATNGEAVNHLVVTISKITHVVHFSPGSKEPDSLQMSELIDFMYRGGASRGDAVLIERSANPEDDDRATILSGALEEQGLRPSVRVAALPTGELRLTIESYAASAPACPDWSKPPGSDLANTLPSDFGCATDANLAAMVADPRDLIEGRKLSPASGDPAIAGLQRYRTGKVTPLPDASAGATAIPLLTIPQGQPNP